MHKFSTIQTPFPSPSREDSTMALQSTPWHLDRSFWQANYTPAAYPDTPLTTYIDKWITDGHSTLQYDHIANPKRCPRRYPIIAPQLRCSTFLLSQSDLTESDQRLYLSNLPKRLRPVLQPKPGAYILDFDLSQAHLHIAAMLSGDTQLKQDLQDDLHQNTGDHFAEFSDCANSRRAFGKRFNNAIMMGISPDGVMKMYTKVFGYRSDIPTVQQVESLYMDWWVRYPTLKSYRIEHADYLRDLRNKNQGYQIKYGRNMATYSSEDIQGELYKQTKTRKWTEILRSTWSRYITAYEAAIMEGIFVLAHHHGLRMGLPMYDGAMWVYTNDTNLEPFFDAVEQHLTAWNLPSTAYKYTTSLSTLSTTTVANTAMEDV